jgi:prefoldin subunit 5
MATKEAVSDELKYGGIPRAEFITDLAETLRVKECSPEEMIHEMQELYEKYRLAKARLEQNKGRLLRKIPEIRKALQSLQLLRQQPAGTATKTHFQLADNLYAKARIEQPERVFLWLGANILLEYPAAEAEELLQKNCSVAEQQLAVLDETLDYVSDQITVTEVNIARVFNYRVKLQRLVKQQQQSAPSLPAPPLPSQLD